MNGTVVALRPSRSRRRRPVMDEHQARAALTGANACERLANRVKDPETVARLRADARELRTLARQWALADDERVVS